MEEVPSPKLQLNVAGCVQIVELALALKLRVCPTEPEEGPVALQVMSQLLMVMVPFCWHVAMVTGIGPLLSMIETVTCQL